MKEGNLMKKKIYALAISILCGLFIANSNIALANGITVKLYGEPLIFDVQPQIINGRTMVPMRTIFESLGATVEWNQSTQTITSVKDDTTITLTIGVPAIAINQYVPRELDAAPCIVDGRTLVPVRAISEAFHMNVDWDEVTQTVFITPPNVNPTGYNALKNAILTKGQEFLSENPTIYYKDQEYSMLFSYEPVGDFLSIYFNYGNNVSVLLFIYEDMNPSILFKSNTSTGDEQILHADFTKKTEPFIITSSTIKDYLFSPTINLINKSLALMDTITQIQTGVSFLDLGVFYPES